MRRVMGQLTGPCSMAGCAMASELLRTSSTKLGTQPSCVVGCIQQSAACCTCSLDAVSRMLHMQSIQQERCSRCAPCHIESVNANVLVPNKYHGVRCNDVRMQESFREPPFGLRFCRHLCAAPYGATMSIICSSKSTRRRTCTTASCQGWSDHASN